MILRALFALIACLLALLPPGTLASIPRTAFVPPPVALFAVEFCDAQDCGLLTLHLDGLHDRAGPCRGVLVRQNPWSAFDPEGLFEWSKVGNHLGNTASGVLGYGNDLLGSAWETLSLGTNGFHSSQQFTDKTVNLVRGAGNCVINDAGQAMRGAAVQVSRGNFGQAFDQAMSAFGDTHEEQVANLITVAVTEGTGRLMRGKASAEAPGGRSAQTTVAVTQAEVMQTYHRLGDSPETVAKIKESGELWGQPPKNIFASDIPKAKAFDGPLPEGATGFEFKSSVPPDGGSVPGKPTWSGQRPGVITENGWAKIKVDVTKDTVTPKPSTTGRQN